MIILLTEWEVMLAIVSLTLQKSRSSCTTLDTDAEAYDSFANRVICVACYCILVAKI